VRPEHRRKDRAIRNGRGPADGEMLYLNRFYPDLVNKAVYPHDSTCIPRRRFPFTSSPRELYSLWLNGAEVCARMRDVLTA